MTFEAIPDKTRFDCWFAQDCADTLNAVARATAATELDPATVAAVLALVAVRFRLEVHT